MTDNRRMTTDRFYGGISNRLENLSAMLEYIRDSNPSRSQLNNWVVSNTPANSAGAVSHHLTFLQAIDFIKLSKTHCELAEYGEKWLTDQSSETLYYALSSGVKGFDTILQALQTDSMTDEGIMHLLVREFSEANMKKPGPAIRHREWLQVMGFVERSEGVNQITDEGEKIIQARKNQSIIDPSSIPPINIDIKTFYSKDEIESLFNIELGYQVSSINERKDRLGREYIILMTNKKWPYTNSVKEQRFDYVGEGKKKDEEKFPPGDDSLIKAHNQTIPIHLFYAWGEDEDWLYRGLVEVTDYEIQSMNDKEVPIFTIEHQELFEKSETKAKDKNTQKAQTNIEHEESSSVRNTEGNTRKQRPKNPDIARLRKKAEESAVEEVPKDVSVSNSEKIQYNRSPEVRKYVKVRANGLCEGCEEAAPFVSKTGKPYLHAHHIHELSDGGSDTPDTVVAICPNCHYRVHHGEDGKEYNQKLLEIVQQKEKNISKRENRTD